MDCAKGVGARLARPEKSIPQMKGELKIRRKIPLLIAVPTTAGTGSEATVVAVVSNSQTHEKYAINDMSLIPHYAVLDPLLTVQLPPHITSTTGEPYSAMVEKSMLPVRSAISCDFGSDGLNVPIPTLRSSEKIIRSI